MARQCRRVLTGTVSNLIDTPTNPNRTILKVINTNKVEPIKANITQNTVANTIEIRVTYTKNGIKEIVDENGNKLTLKEENGVILADTGEKTLGIGTYSFTVVDNKGNRQNLIITPDINSIYKVAYINGTDNMDNTATYTKTTQTPTSTETALINQIKATDTTRTYSRAITDSNKAITAITQTGRTTEDEQMYLWNRYKVNSETKYVWNAESATSSTYNKPKGNYDGYYYYKKMEKSSSGDRVTLSSSTSSTISSPGVSGGYTFSNTFSKSSIPSSSSTTSSYYYWSGASGNGSTYTSYGTHYYRTVVTEYSRGDSYGYTAEEESAYENNQKNGSYWYARGNILPKYTLYKYSSNLTLQSTYDVDTKTLTTAPIDISNRENNKLKLTLTATGTDYKTYISNDNANWKEVTDVTSGVSKEVNVDGWNNLYIKIETNTSTINNIDVAYYKD